MCQDVPGTGLLGRIWPCEGKILVATGKEGLFPEGRVNEASLDVCWGLLA